MIPPRDVRATISAREQLTDGHAEHHTDGCLVWSDWTAADDRRLDAAWVRAMEKPRPVTVPASYRGLRTV